MLLQFFSDATSDWLARRANEERGWELMWLITGCFAPSTNLLKEVMLFLRSIRDNVVAIDCQNRLQRTLRWAEGCGWISVYFEMMYAMGIQLNFEEGQTKIISTA